jgi:hypothetical protein
MTIDETTSATQHLPRGVHLVGSVPLGDAEDVFRAATAILGGRLRRIPDGACSLILSLPLLSCKLNGTNRSLSRCLFSERMSQVASTGHWKTSPAPFVSLP